MQVVCCGWREFPLPLFGRTARKPHPLPESACLHPGSTLQLFLRMPLGASRHAVHLPINYQVLTTNTQQKCCMNLRALFLKLRATQRFHHVPLKATNAPEPKRRSNSSHLCRDIPPPHLGLLTDPWFLFSCLVAGTPSHPNMSQNKLPQHLLLQMALQFRRYGHPRILCTRDLSLSRHWRNSFLLLISCRGSTPLPRSLQLAGLEAFEIAQNDHQHGARYGTKYDTKY